MKIRKCVTSLCALTIFVAHQAFAINFGADITVNDKMFNLTDPTKPLSWWSNREDNEVEPGVLWRGQIFDLEGFFLDGTHLTIVSGYNFWSPPPGMLPGSLFIDVDGDAVYGNLPGQQHPIAGGGSGNNLEANIWGYDFVYDIDYVNNTYNIYEIDETTMLRNVTYGSAPDLRGANPWRFERDHNPNASLVGSGSLVYWDMLNYLTDADLTAYGIIGGGTYLDATYIDQHFALQVSLAPLSLADGSVFTSKYTMECGNDSLVGQGTITIPDGGSTLTLISVGLLAVVVFRRRVI